MRVPPLIFFTLYFFKEVFNMYVKKSTLKLIGNIVVNAMIFSSGALMTFYGIKTMESVVRGYIKE